MKKILILDDEKNICESLRILLQDEYEILISRTGREALARLNENPALVICDIILPDTDGLEVLRQIRRSHPILPVVMLSAVDRIKTVVEAMRLGAVDYIAKPFDTEELKLTVRRMLEVGELHEEVEYLQEITKEHRQAEFIGASPAARAVLAHVDLAARTDSSVLITGESGVGKEVVAKLIHLRSPRADKPFLPVHCAALPESLFESELFGYEKGAFTDAAEQKAGMFDLAKDGTIFLDEIGEMPGATQAKILRVLQEREFIRLGGTSVVKTQARVLAATSKNLEQEISTGAFRPDLYYRLNVVRIAIPPLRERREDVPLLAEHFFRQLRKTLHVTADAISPDALQALREYSWPGNVRELKNVIERALVLHGGDPTIAAGHLTDCLGGRPASAPTPVPNGTHSLEESVRHYESMLIRTALDEAGGVKSRAAKLLATTRRILTYRMKKLGLS